MFGYMTSGQTVKNDLEMIISFPACLDAADRADVIDIVRSRYINRQILLRDKNDIGLVGVRVFYRIDRSLSSYFYRQILHRENDRTSGT